MKKRQPIVSSNGMTLKPNKPMIQTHQKWYWQTLVIAIVVLLISFSMIPLFLTVVNSMKTAKEVQMNAFAMPSGDFLKAIATNYKEAWGYIGDKFFKTVGIAIIGAIGETMISAALAYILCFKDFYFKNVVFMFFISILMVPSIIGYPVLTPFVRDVLHLGGTYWGFLIPMIGGAQVGGMFLFRTFFGQQPKSLYESARIEGCSDIRIFFEVTIPLALPIILYYFVGAFSAVYNNFLWASLILSDSNMTMMYTLYSVTNAISGQDKEGITYAMYMISAVPLIITTIISMKYFKSGEFAAGLKL